MNRIAEDDIGNHMRVAIRYAAGSDVGRARENNEDSAYAGPWLLAVADGMGGHVGGEIASSLAIQALSSLPDTVNAVGALKTSTFDGIVGSNAAADAPAVARRFLRRRYARRGDR